MAILIAAAGSRNPRETLAEIRKSVPAVEATDLLLAADVAKATQKTLRGLWWRIEQKRAQDELKQQMKQKFRQQYAHTHRCSRARAKA